MSAILFSYLIGSIPTAYLIGKANGIDIRKHGSGNVGATNVFRTMGKRWGTFALILDITKGFVASFWLARHFYPEWNLSLVSVQLLSGFAAIAGHTWPIWLRFKGGKGVATSCGVFLGIYPGAVFFSLLVWILVAYSFRYVSLASMAAALSFPFFLYFFYQNHESFKLSLGVSFALCFFIFYTHRKNIERLKAGTENRIGTQK